MAQVISAQSVKMRFPEFADTPATQIEFAIEEAALSVDATWGTLQSLGMLYMTAHILMCGISRAASATGQKIATESFAGVMSVTYQTESSSIEDPSVKDLDSTFYGMRFRDLLERKFPAVAII